MRPRNWLAGLASLYVIACVLSPIGPNPTPGFLYLIYVPVMVVLPAWWANPTFFAGCLALASGKTGLACVLGIVASALAMSIAAYIPLPRFQAGAWFWFASMFGLAASGFISRPVEKPVMPPELPGEPAPPWR